MFGTREKTARFAASPISSIESPYSENKTGSILKNSNKRKPLSAFAEEKTEIIFPETYETHKTTYDQNIDFSKGKVANRFNMLSPDIPVSSPPNFSTSFSFSSAEDRKIFHPSPELKTSFQTQNRFIPQCENRTILDVINDYENGNYEEDMYAARSEDVDAFLSQIQFPEIELPTYLSPLSLTTEGTSNSFDELLKYLNEGVSRLNDENNNLLSNIQQNIPNAIASIKLLGPETAKTTLSYANKLAMQHQNEALFDILTKLKDIEEDHQKTLQFIQQLKEALQKCEEALNNDKFIQANMKYKEIQRSMKEYKEQHGDVERKKDIYCTLHKLLCYRVTSLQKGIATILTTYQKRPITVQHNPKSVNAMYSSFSAFRRAANLRNEISELSLSFPSVLEEDVNQKIKIVSIVFSNLGNNIRFCVDFTIYIEQYPYQKLIVKTNCLINEDKNIAKNVNAICNQIPIGNKPLTDAAMKIKATFNV